MKQLNILSIFLFLTFLFSIQTAKAQYNEQKIFSDDGDQYDRFGESIGISGDFLICGAWANDGGGEVQGAAYIFYNNAGNWEQHSKLLVEEAEDNDHYGTSVCIDGDFAVVTTTRNGYFEARGAVAIFKNNAGTWEQQIWIEHPELPEESMFGYSSAIDRNNVIIGMRPFNSDVGLPGAGYIYNYNGTTWTETAELVPDEAIAGDAVGNCVAISGNYAIVSAHGTDFPTSNEGAAYIYKNIDGTWTEMQKLVSSEPQIDGYFGAYVDINQNYAIVGALMEDVNGTINQGAVYVFENTDDVWTQVDKITASDGQVGDTFGSDFDFNDDLLIIGSRNNGNNGAVYVYENISGTWTFSEKIEPTDGTGNDTFGDAIALDNDIFIVGAAWNDISGQEKQGAAYIYSPSPISEENNITNFDVPNQVGEETINNTEHTVTLDVEAGTDVTTLIPTIEISTNATIDPASGVSQDFTTPVEYTVTAENGDEQIWTVTITVLPTNINDISQNNFIIYPNPSNGFFTISYLSAFAKPESVEITDLTGKIILNSQFSILNSQFSIKEKGLYFITIKTETNIYTQKIIIN